MQLNHKASVAQVDWGFAVYAVRGEELSGKVDYLIRYLIVIFYEETFITAAEHVTHQNYLHATITFILEVRGVNFITSA